MVGIEYEVDLISAYWLILGMDCVGVCVCGCVGGLVMCIVVLCGGLGVGENTRS